MESRRSSLDLRDIVPGEEQQTFPELTQSSLGPIEDRDMDTRTGEISFSPTTTEIADEDTFRHIESQDVATPTAEVSFSRTTTEIADDDFLSRLSIEEFTETSEAQQDVPLSSNPAMKTGKRAKKLLQSVTKWKEDIQYLMRSQPDYQDLTKSLGTIKDDMASVIADCNDERAKLIAVITKLGAQNSTLSLRMRQERSADQPKQIAVAESELHRQKKKKGKKKKQAPTEYLEDVQCRALTLSGEAEAEPIDIPMSTATRSAGWSSQQLPKTRPPPPLTLENLPLPRQRSVGGDWTAAAFEASELKPSQSPSTELSPDTPTKARKSIEMANKWPTHGIKKRDSITFTSQRLSVNKAQPPPAKRRSQKVPGTKSHRISPIIGEPAGSAPRAHYPTDALRDSASPDNHAPPNTTMHNSEEDQVFDRESDEGEEESSNNSPPSRFPSRPLSFNAPRLSRFSTWMLNQSIQTILNMARLGRDGQSLDQELDAVGVEEASDWDPASQRSSRYIALRSRQSADRNSCVLYDTTQDLHTTSIDNGGQNKSAGGLLKRAFAVAYLGLFVVTIQVYFASLRQQQIWLNANGLTREYMLRSCLETPAWMLVPGVDGKLVIGVDEAKTALSWLWQLLP